jgi:hypothetical protein
MTAVRERLAALAPDGIVVEQSGGRLLVSSRNDDA